jgi:lipopolysaccharide/colanic/teichoic acid biosynthesis glycosyltransferase
MRAPPFPAGGHRRPTLTARALFGRAVGGVALLAVLPVIAATALAVWTTLGRPILFRQGRSGMGQRPFDLVKFRTMTDRRDAAGLLMPDEQRTPPVGRFLRYTRLDELPSLINVARGDLNLIGPRPLLPETISAMGAIGHQRARVAPGMTGWAQVNGNVLLTNEEKVALDLWYIEHRSVMLDVYILLRTLWVVTFGERVRADRLATARSGTNEAS